MSGRVNNNNYAKKIRVMKSIFKKYKPHVRWAARKRTYGWNEPMAVVKGIRKGSFGNLYELKKVRREFKGNHGLMYNRARSYHKRLVHEIMHSKPKSYNTNLYRGIKNYELKLFENAWNSNNKKVHKNSLSSFSKNKNIANSYGKLANIIISTKNKKIPSINYTSKEYQSEYAPGGIMFKTNPKNTTYWRKTNKNEQEVLLPPGTFIIRNKKSNTKNHYYVNFIPNSYS